MRFSPCIESRAISRQAHNRAYITNWALIATVDLYWAFAVVNGGGVHSRAITKDDG